MKNDLQIKDETLNTQSNRKIEYRGFINISEDEKLLEDYRKSGIEKLQLFTKMLRRNAMFNKAKLITKPK